jgi:hypothetical protein
VGSGSTPSSAKKVVDVGEVEGFGGDELEGKDDNNDDEKLQPV